MHSRFRWSGRLGGVVVVAATLAVHPFAAGQQDTPTFRSGVRLVDVDVVVTDSAGNPVRDLTPDEFEIIEDGRRQEARTRGLQALPCGTARRRALLR